MWGLSRCSEANTIRRPFGDAFASHVTEFMKGDWDPITKAASQPFVPDHEKATIALDMDLKQDSGQ